jgi:hypothetical protein
MSLRDYRWQHTQQGIPIEVGHFEVANMSRSGLLTAVQSAVNGWTGPLAGPTFVVVDGGDAVYDHHAMDGRNSVCWFLSDCSIGDVTVSGQPTTKARPGGRCRLPPGHGCPWGDYCWYDCATAHSHPCAPDDEYDAQTVLLHEFGHGIVGLDHYSPCDWTQSVMFSHADVNCARHRELGTADVQYARMEFEAFLRPERAHGRRPLRGDRSRTLYFHGDQVDEDHRLQD